jgi:hypothetical protein
MTISFIEIFGIPIMAWLDGWPLFSFPLVILINILGSLFTYYIWPRERKINYTTSTSTGTGTNEAWVPTAPLVDKKDL